jgi:hypothetical protein
MNEALELELSGRAVGFARIGIGLLMGALRDFEGGTHEQDPPAQGRRQHPQPRH